MGSKQGAVVKKTPTRQCVGCGEKRDKKELVRIIRSPEENIEVDFTGKKNGRGAYICNNPKCLERAQKRKSIERSLKISIPEEIYQELAKELMKNAN